MPLPTTVPRRIPATGKPELRLIQKTGAKPQMAVYGADGALLGVCDPDAIQELATPPGQPAKTAQAAVDANAAQVQANADVQKAMAGLLHGFRPRPVPAGTVRKAATTLNEQFTALCKTVGDSHATAIKSTVANASLKAMTAGGVDGAAAVRSAKRAAVQYAVNKKII